MTIYNNTFINIHINICSFTHAYTPTLYVGMFVCIFIKTYLRIKWTIS